jgi:signal transduction histidine kinase
MRNILLFLILSIVFNPKKSLSNSNEIDSLIQRTIDFAKKNQNDSVDYALNKLVPKVVGNELDSLLKLRRKSTKDLIKGVKVINAKSQMQSVILLFICLFSFIYLIYYTDKINREKQIKKIKAANRMSLYESNLRKQISETLHDDIGGSIIALKMKFINKEGMKNEVQLLSNIYERVRELSSDLDMQHKFSQSIEDGINILVNEMCNAFDKKSINVFPDKINEITDNAIIEAVIMTTKELITNVIKHAKASEISIDISLIDNQINIIVQDNGVGMKKQQAWGLGLKSIQNRAILHEGNFDIDTNTRGTTAHVKFKTI